MAERVAQLLYTANGDEHEQALLEQVLAVHARAVVGKMEDPKNPTSMWIDDGVYSAGCQEADETLKEQLSRAPKSSDPSERAFATLKAVVGRSHGVSSISAVGVAMAQLNGVFEQPGGEMHKMPQAARDAIVRLSHKHLQSTKEQLLDDKLKQVLYFRNKREQVRLRKLDRVLSHNARALELFNCGCSVSTVAGLEEQWRSLKGEKNRYDFLKAELMVYRHGYGFKDASTRWTVNKKPVAASELKAVLKGILVKVAAGELVVPNAAPVGRGAVKEAKLLGTLTEHKVKILQLQKEAVSGDKAKQFVEERRGRKRKVHKARHAILQPADPPMVQVGMKVEVNTRVTCDGQDYNHWLPGEVSCVSDGSQTVITHLVSGSVRKRGAKGKKGPVGWAMVKFDDGYEDWFQMVDEMFNNAAARSWRVDLDYGADGCGEFNPIAQEL